MVVFFTLPYLVHSIPISSRKSSSISSLPTMFNSRMTLESVKFCGVELVAFSGAFTMTPARPALSKFPIGEKTDAAASCVSLPGKPTCSFLSHERCSHALPFATQAPACLLCSSTTKKSERGSEWASEQPKPTHIHASHLLRDPLYFTYLPAHFSHHFFCD